VRAPPRPTTTRAFASSLALLSLIATPAAAKSPGYRLELVRGEGAGSCPGAEAIEREVVARLGRNPFTQHGERGIEIAIERSEQVWRAKLFLRVDPSEPDALRVIESEAAECAELGKSVVLAVALAIAPELEPEAPPPPPAPSCPPPPPPPAPVPVEHPTLHAAVALRGLLSPELLPGTSLGGALALSLRGSLVGANFGALFFPEYELRQGGQHLGFGLSAGFASGCLWARTAQPELWGCLGARLGVLHAVVYEPRPEQPGDRFWAAATTELGLRQTLVARLFVEGGAVASFPLTRYRFQVGPDSAPAYQESAAVWEGFLGLGLRLD
jgi:hypothetical protein